MQPLPLSVQQIDKSFKNHHVLHSIQMEVKEGEIFGLIGLNGAGKTTMIKILLDLLSADAGEASFFGVSVKDPASRKAIAYLPEKFTPSAYLKGREFLSLSLSHYGISYNREEAVAAAEDLGLNPEVLDRPVGKYSKGMGQKIGLLSMFLSRRKLLILDEPMSGLDPSARIQLKDKLLDYRHQGNTIFFSSHILADIEEICDRIAVLHEGKILYTGIPQDFVGRYQGKNLERSFLQAIGQAA